MGCLHQVSPFRTQGTLQKRRWKDHERQRGWRNQENKVFTTEGYTYELGETVAAGIRPGWFCIRWGQRTEKEKWTNSPIPSGKLLTIDRHLQMKKSSFLQGRNKTFPRVVPMLSSRWGTQNKLNRIFGCSFFVPHILFYIFKSGIFFLFVL